MTESQDVATPERREPMAAQILRLRQERDALFAAAVAVQNQHNPRSEAGDALRKAIAQSVLIRLSHDDHEALLVALGGCPKCDHDEAEGEIYRHCDDCMATVTKIMFVACSYNRDMCHLGTPGCASDHAQGEPCETLPA